jgi:hypothetical protein
MTAVDRKMSRVPVSGDEEDSRATFVKDPHAYEWRSIVVK